MRKLRYVVKVRQSSWMTLLATKFRFDVNIRLHLMFKVLSGINISSRKFNSGFPVDSSSLQMHENLEYTESGWNLNNTPMLPGSLLLFENSETSTASVPNLFVGMCFSSLCWVWI